MRTRASRGAGRQATADHRLWLNHRGPADVFCAVSAAAVLDGTAGPRLKDRIAVVAFSKLGADTVATPFSPQLPGAALHVTLASDVLRGDPRRSAAPHPRPRRPRPRRAVRRAGRADVLVALAGPRRRAVVGRRRRAVVGRRCRRARA
ncbi:MAG: CHASE2 domain-containing protein [Deltaproteobacteria bacterium]|nr:CHASE2 domain-containing protein [Deltaproteobacteria bacterium]